MSNLGSLSDHQTSSHQGGSPSGEQGPLKAPGSPGGVFHYAPRAKTTNPPFVQHESFQYDPSLNEKHIRLLDFLPNESDSTIRCTLTTYPLAKVPSYYALSYVWGDTCGPSTTILICGKGLKITKSLHASLLTVKRLQYSPLWIDQICINQQDEEERNRQVGIMRNIYQGAESALISLGEDFDGVAASFCHLLTAFEGMDPLILRGCPWKGMCPWEGSFPRDGTLAFLGLPESTHSCWSALEIMVSMPYFERVWVVQEVVMAKQALIIHEAGAPIKWSSFLNMMSWFIHHEWTMPNISAPYAIPTNRSLGIYMDFWSRREACPRTLYHLAQHFRDLKSSWPKDKIFAITGIAEDGDAVPIEYGKLDREVFEDFARYVIDAEKNLNILSDVIQDDQNRGDTPSWVPRWNVPCSRLYKWGGNSELLCISEVSIDPQQEPKVLKVKGKHLAFVTDKVLRFEFDTTQIFFVVDLILALREKGFLIDEEASQAADVKRITDLARCLSLGSYALTSVEHDRSPLPVDGEDKEILHDLRTWLSHQLLLAMMSLNFKAARNCIRAAPTVFKGDSNDVSSRPEGLPEMREKSRVMMESLKANYQSLDPSLFQDRSSVDKLFDGAFRVAQDDARVKRFALSLASVQCTPRSIFMTHDGFMGVGPPNLQQSDVICALYGGPMPYALRPSSPPGNYTFLGDCYIPRKMDLGTFLKTSENPDKWFWLI